MIYTLDTPDEPPLRPRFDARDAVCLASMTYHPDVHLKAANYALFSFYQDWVYQNPGNNMKAESKRMVSGKISVEKLSAFQPNATTYRLVS